MQSSKRSTLLHFSSRTSWLTFLAGECVKCKMQYPAKNLNYELYMQVARIFSFFASCLDLFFFVSCLDFFSFFASCLNLFSLFCKLPEWPMCPLGFYITTNWVRRRCGLESGGNLSTFIFYHFRNLSPCISKKLPSLLWKVTKNTYFV